MLAVLNYALDLAVCGVRFFPVSPNSKLPAIGNFSQRATDDPAELERTFANSNYNSGIACGKVAEDLYLVGVDIDNKPGRDGFKTLQELDILGKEFPSTWTQQTPSGGQHMLYWSSVPIRQGTDVFGVGIDTRGDGGYLVGPGSAIDGKFYTPTNTSKISRLPQWIADEYEKTATVLKIHEGKAARPVEDQVLALKQSVEFLQRLEPSVAGNRNNDCFAAVCKLKDFGLSGDQVPDVILEYWKCEPMLDLYEISAVVNAAYKYGHNDFGVLAPENVFTKVEEAPPTEKNGPQNPILKLNEDHFYVACDGISRVCWETTKKGKFYLERFPVFNFHEKHAATTMDFGDKPKAVTKLWMVSPKRRTYKHVLFDPGNRLPEDTYNTWRGFHIKPSEGGTPKAREAVDLFLEHCRENICAGDPLLTHWLLGFFAHLFQFPDEKPEVSLVFRGKKGTGKTIVSVILNHLIGDNSVIVADKAHVLNHFNSIMEDKILITLDEAFWSGDKSIEGILKYVITGQDRVITRKGAEPYKTQVYDRIIIVGNESWMVPASADERRYAVFNMGTARRQDRNFFGKIMHGLVKEGGAGLLMRYFLNYDLSQIDVNIAPSTEGLDEQKNISLDPIAAWWKECLEEGRVLGSGADDWPEKMKVQDFFDSFIRQTHLEGGRTPFQVKVRLNLSLKEFCKRLYTKVLHFDGKNHRCYLFPPLPAVRDEWDEHMGFKTKWE